jgi:hypothetical protein
MSAGFMFLVLKKRITERVSHAAGFSNFLNIVNTQDDEQKRLDCLQMISLTVGALPTFPTSHTFPEVQQTARMRTIVTIVTAALQRQYLQTELILWIPAVLAAYKILY